MDVPSTRAEAKARGLPHYFTGKPCVNGHVALRKTKGACVECLKQEWAESNARRAQLPKSEAAKAAGRRYYERNRDRVIEAAQRRPSLEKRRHRNTHKARNPDVYRVLTNQRRRRNREATPKSLLPADKRAMRALYEQAALISETTGIPHEVDHIVPLRHPAVCGLHVPWNLRVLTAEENARKSNAWTPQ